MVIRWRAGRARVCVLMICVSILFFVPCLHAQTVRPVIAEYTQKARARYDLVNDSLVPLNVVLEPKSFSIGEDGSPSFRPLDKSIHLRLSQMSFRIPPQQTYYVFYEATADSYPAWFVIYATFAGLPKQTGLNVQVELPHTVYLFQKQALQESDIQVRAAEFFPGKKQISLEIENTGERLGRVADVEIRGEREKAVEPGFPLMPRSRRKLRLDWKPGAAPHRVIFRFKKFKVESPIQEMNN